MAQREFDQQSRRTTHPPRSADSPQRGERSEHPLLNLQRTIGNAQVARMLQRASESEEEEAEAVQAKRDVGAEGGSLGVEATSQLQGLRGGGSPLDAGLRTSLEGALGTSFADVRVHTGSQADSLNRGMGARAFTSGSDVVLRGDQSPSDTHLMAHELTHVVQQRSMATDAGSGGVEVRPAGDSYEQAADASAERLQRDGLV